MVVLSGILPFCFVACCWYVYIGLCGIGILSLKLTQSLCDVIKIWPWCWVCLTTYWNQTDYRIWCSCHMGNIHWSIIEPTCQCLGVDALHNHFVQHFPKTVCIYFICVLALLNFCYRISKLELLWINFGLILINIQLFTYHLLHKMVCLLWWVLLWVHSQCGSLQSLSTWHSCLRVPAKQY